MPIHNVYSRETDAATFKNLENVYDTLQKYIKNHAKKNDPKFKARCAYAKDICAHLEAGKLSLDEIAVEVTKRISNFVTTSKDHLPVNTLLQIIQDRVRPVYPNPHIPPVQQNIVSDQNYVGIPENFLNKTAAQGTQQQQQRSDMTTTPPEHYGSIGGHPTQPSPGRVGVTPAPVPVNNQNLAPQNAQTAKQPTKYAQPDDLHNAFPSDVPAAAVRRALQHRMASPAITPTGSNPSPNAGAPIASEPVNPLSTTEQLGSVSKVQEEGARLKAQEAGGIYESAAAVRKAVKEAAVKEHAENYTNMDMSGKTGVTPPPQPAQPITPSAAAPAPSQTTHTGYGNARPNPGPETLTYAGASNARDTYGIANLKRHTAIFSHPAATPATQESVKKLVGILSLIPSETAKQIPMLEKFQEKLDIQPIIDNASQFKQAIVEKLGSGDIKSPRVFSQLNEAIQLTEKIIAQNKNIGPPAPHR